MAGDDDVCGLKEIPIENEHWLKILNTPGSYLPDTVGAPACELFSVGVCRNSQYFQHRDTFQIYGTITLYDIDNTAYDLYCRASCDSQTLTPQHNLLSLDMSLECLVSTTWPHMFLSLMDKADDAVIVEQYLNFDKLTDINQCNKVELADNSVFVTYAAFRAAVGAILKITLIKKNDSAPVPINLSGKIIARYGNTYGQKYPGIVLLNSRSFEAISNVPILLSRDVVVMPAYSFLRIDLHLSQLDQHQQEDITCHVDFLPRDLDNHDIVTKDFDVRFNVQWRHPYELKDKAREPFKHTPRYPLFHKDTPFVSGELSTRKLVYSLVEDYSLVEVYAVTIHHDTNSELKICGTMGIRDNISRFLLFDRNELNRFEFSGNEETIPIAVERRCFNFCEYLSMALRLKDVEGQVLIEGEIFWNDRRVEKPMSWYDKHICSVIRGVHGYAEVFYTIFSKAVQAKVRITFKWYGGDGDVIYCLDGSVVARHSNGTYLTEHDKTYYQSVLFRGNSSNVESGCTLPLLKSVVAVPIGAFLTVAVDLYASPSSLGLPLERLKSDISFNLGSEIPQIIHNENCCIEVSVEWSDLHKLFSEEINLLRKNHYGF